MRTAMSAHLDASGAEPGRRPPAIRSVAPVAAGRAGRGWLASVVLAIGAVVLGGSVWLISSGTAADGRSPLAIPLAVGGAAATTALLVWRLVRQSAVYAARDARLTERIEAVLGVADRVALIENGRIARHATPAELAAEPEVLLRYVGVRR